MLEQSHRDSFRQGGGVRSLSVTTSGTNYLKMKF